MKKLINQFLYKRIFTGFGVILWAIYFNIVVADFCVLLDAILIALLVVIVLARMFFYEDKFYN